MKHGRKTERKKKNGRKKKNRIKEKIKRKKKFSYSVVEARPLLLEVVLSVTPSNLLRTSTLVRSNVAGIVSTLLSEFTYALYSRSSQ